VEKKKKKSEVRFSGGSEVGPLRKGESGAGKWTKVWCLGSSISGGTGKGSQKGGRGEQKEGKVILRSGGESKMICLAEGRGKKGF